MVCSIKSPWWDTWKESKETVHTVQQTILNFVEISHLNQQGIQCFEQYLEIAVDGADGDMQLGASSAACFRAASESQL
jgi:hypothetical protein